MSAYSAAILATTGLSAYYRMDEASGLVAVDATGAVAGAYRNAGVTLAVASARANMGTCARLGDEFAAGWMIVPHHASNTFAGDFTLEVWAKTIGTTGAILNKYGGSPFTGYGIDMLSGKAAAWVGDTVGSYLTGTVTINNGTWHLLHLTRAGTAIRLYVDGALDVSGTRTPSLASTTDLAVATSAASPGASSTAGHFDELALYSVALSDAQVAAHFAAASDAVFKTWFAGRGSAIGSGVL